ncbi:alpha/beta fold hydrolase [Rhodovulum tesquicola]|uniref:alpha/beta fold hydrolase n=1 Tax=Rhodovulum tesquicola TaxID=540254 RepID=UPI0020974B80|nr:alpha/beta fold hydrolase [Rhodovulum tesquicola]MCO8146594.1 alpha/beta fold hydrolase [Rhodovulum tesquicola]
MLATRIHGQPGATPPLLIAHGLFGSARNWGVIAKRLSDSRQVIAVDMRNHGDSPWASGHRYADLAADLAEVIAAHGGRADMLGHSMGGKAAMVLALTRPALVNRLVVADIAPVAYGHSQNHLIAAMRGLELAGLTHRGNADAALSARIADPGVRAFLLQSLDLKARPPVWRLNLDVLEAEMDRITGWPEEIAGRFDGPALFLSGATSDYVRPEHRDRIKALFPAARFARIPGAGHWLHAEKPREFEAAVRAFLDAQMTGPSRPA